MAIAYDHRVLRQWRLDDGRTPEQICVAAPISYPYLRQLEDGHGTPSAAMLARLASVYGRDVGELFTTDPAGAR
jgi:transcriptional regulator with XRE-family HTH domain